MANMSYCRFENTLNDLQDCQANIDDISDLSESELRARKQLILLCIDIATDQGGIFDPDFTDDSI